MSSLTAEKRLDRNGILVTRWVRQDANASANSRGIPAPSLSVIPAHHKHAISIIKALHDARGANGDNLVNKHSGTAQDYSVNELTEAMTVVLPPESLKLAATLLENDYCREMKQYLINGTVEIAEDYLGQSQSPLGIEIEDSFIGRITSNIELAGIVEQSSYAEMEFRDTIKIIRNCESDSNWILSQLVKQGSVTTDQEDDEAIWKLKIGTFIHRVATGNTNYPDADTILKMHEERYRITPHLREFERRKAFSFELLEELEGHSTLLNDGVL